MQSSIFRIDFTKFYSSAIFASFSNFNLRIPRVPFYKFYSWQSSSRHIFLILLLSLNQVGRGQEEPRAVIVQDFLRLINTKEKDTESGRSKSRGNHDERSRDALRTWESFSECTPPWNYRTDYISLFTLPENQHYLWVRPGEFRYRSFRVSNPNEFYFFAWKKWGGTRKKEQSPSFRPLLTGTGNSTDREHSETDLPSVPSFHARFETNNVVN